MGCCACPDIRLLAIAAAAFGITLMSGASEAAPKWSAGWATTTVNGSDFPSDCRHQRQGAYYGLWESVVQGCDERTKTELKLGGNPNLPNRDAFRVSRLAGMYLGLVGLGCAAYYLLTGCCVRVVCVERVAAVAMLLAGAFALAATGFWFYRFDKRPFDDDATDDREVCDLGCQLAFAAGGLAVVLGFAMLCLSNGLDLVGRPSAAEDDGLPGILESDLEMPAVYRRVSFADLPCSRELV